MKLFYALNKAVLFALSFILLLSSQAIAQPGTLNLNFNPGMGANSTVSALLVQPDSKILLAGSFTSYNGVASRGIARANANGSIDASFTPGSGADLAVTSLAVQSDGKILIGGNFKSYNGTPKVKIARLHADGTLDASFNIDSARFVANAVSSVAVQPDGKIIIGGFFSYNTGTIVKTNLLRLNSDGSLDASFNAGGSGANQNVFAIAMQPDGKILIGGAFTLYNNTLPLVHFARLNADGSVDGTFNLVSPNSNVMSIALQPDGKILAAGGFSSFSGIQRPRIARINSDGTLDNTFNPGTSFNNLVTTIKLQSDGKVLAGGFFTAFNSITIPNRVARLNADGSLDASFNSGGTGANSTVNSLDLKPTGEILIAGTFINYNGSVRTRIAELLNSATTPNAPTITSASAGNQKVTVAFSPPANNGGSAITSYTVTSSPGNLTLSGTASPIVVSGLTAGVSYTFTAIATNSIGNSAASAVSAAATPYLANTLDLAGLSSSSEPVAAYSTRKLSSAYSGFALRARQTSDNAEVDVAFDANGVISADSRVTGVVAGAGITVGTGYLFNTFYGTGDVHVSKWYDQSGRGFDAVQTGATHQPILIKSGVFKLLNNRPAVYFAGGGAGNPSGGVMTIPFNSSLINVTGAISTVVNQPILQSTFPALLAWSTGSSAGVGFGPLNGPGRFGLYGTWSPDNVPMGTITANTNYVMNASWVNRATSTNTVTESLNGVVNTGGLGGSLFNQNLATGLMGQDNFGSDYFNGTVPELLVLATALSNQERQSLELNQNNYFLSTPLAIASFSPASAGPETPVIITGTGFTGVTGVSFGGVPASSFTVLSPTSITAIPGTSALSGSVIVTTSSSTASQPGFTYEPPFSLASLSTGAPIGITGTTAILVGEINSDGGAEVTERGFAYGTDPNPVISHLKIVSGSGTGSYTENVTGLSPATTYYVRAYGINAAGTSYGEEVSFLTPAIPTLTTVPPISITDHSAVLGGEITNDGGAPIEEQGIVYGLAPEPTVNDNKILVGNDFRGFSQEVDRLRSSTTYFYRAFATNSAGTAYGNGLTFTTAVTPPTITNFTPTIAGSFTTVTITGTGFTGASAVSFGDVAASSFNVVSATTITAVVGTSVSGSVSVTTPGGTATVAGFIFDNTNPVITITSPTAANTYITASNTTAISGTASDNAGVASVTWMNLANGASGSATGTNSWSIPSVSLVAGINTITLTATDEAGNRGTSVITVNRDNINPVITITSPTTAPSYITASNTTSLSGTASDNVGITSVTWMNLANGASGSATGTNSWSIPSVSLVAGINTITLTATDEAGNRGTSVITVNRDNINPVITITSPTTAPSYITASNTTSLSGTASDNAGITSVTWMNLANGASGSATGTNSWSIPSVSLVAGINTITLTAADEAGNRGTGVITVNRDNINPVITITSPTAANTYITASNTTAISGTASDNAGITSVTWMNLANGASGSATGTNSWSVPSVSLVAGSNTITLTATDEAGNRGTGVITVNRDNINPVITITSPTAANIYITASNTTSLSGTASDNVGITSVTWMNLANGASGSATGTNSWSVPSVSLVAGSNTITLTATDEAGNRGTGVITVNRDNINPVITITSPTAANIYITASNTTSLSGTASDNVGITSVTWMNLANGASGSATGTNSWSVPSVSLVAGSNTITLTATDEAGNRGTGVITVNRDNINPVITITSPTAANIYITASNTTSLSGTASDNAGITSVTWMNLANGASGTASGTNSWSVPSVSLVAGINTITLTATDEAGNRGTDDLTITLQAAQSIAFDAIPDKIYGDADFVLIATGGGSGNAVTFSSSNTAVATVTGSSIHIVGTGSTTITASQAGNDSFTAATEVVQQLTVNKADQAITFAPLADKIYGDADFALTATGGASRNAITYTSSNTDVATIVEGSVHIIGAGTTTITASQAGDDNFNAAADVTQSLTVNKAIATIALSDLDHVYDGSAKSATVTTDPAGLTGITIQYERVNANAGPTPPGDGSPAAPASSAPKSAASSSAPKDGSAPPPSDGPAPPPSDGPAPPPSDGPAPPQSSTPTQAGQYTVTVTLENANYQAAPAQAVLTINTADQAITFDALSDKTYGDADFALTATGGASGNAVTYTSSNPDVATLIEGSVHIVGAGTTTLTASQAGNGNYEAAADVSQSLTVNKATAVIALSNLDHVFDGSAKSATANTEPAELGTVNITYNGSPSAPSAAGVYEVRASLDNANYDAEIARATLKIRKADQAITFAPLAARTYGEADFALTASGGASGNPVTYTSSNVNVATIVNGSVHIAGAGISMITASQEGNDNYNAAVYVAQPLTINRASATITLSNLEHVYDGSVKSASATTEPAEIGTVKITYNGSPTAPSGAGVYPVKATVDNANYSAETATATLTINKADQAITFTPLADKTYGEADFALTATGGASRNAITYTSSNTDVATIVEGSVHIIGAGTTTITASQAGDDNFNAAADVTQSLTVNKAIATIALSDLDHVYDGSAKSATVTTDPAGLTGITIQYERVNANAGPTPPGGGSPAAPASSAPKSAASSSAPKDGSAPPPSDGPAPPPSDGPAPPPSDGPAPPQSSTPTQAGQYTVTVTLENANYQAAPAQAVLTINTADQAITFDALSDKTYGDADFALTATGGPSGNPVTYTSSNPDVATLIEGSVHIVGAGTTTLTASQAGNGNYEAAADVSQSLTVNKATAVIALSNLDHVFDGSAKSATANTEPAELGTVNITYNGSPSAPSAAGVYEVRASLDNANYDAETARATLKIRKADQAITFAPLAARTYGEADFALTASGGASGNPVTYTSSNVNVATIVNGSVHIAGAGITMITASQEGNDNYNAAVYVAQPLTINRASATITLSNLEHVYDGSVKSASATTEPAEIGTVKITYNGSPTAPSGAGVYPVKATVDNANYSAETATATLTIRKADQAITFAPLADKTYGEADFALTATGGASRNAITYTSSNTDVATIVEGSVHVVGAGTTTITASQAGDDNFNAAADVTQSLTVNKAIATIALSDLDHVYDGSAKSATVTTDPAGLGTINISYNGSASAPVASGVYPVKATLSNANYVAQTTTGILTISKADQAITFAPLADKTFGDADFALTATGGQSGNAVTYSSSNANVATIVNGSVHIVGVGLTTITASQFGNDNYTAAADVARSLTVNKANATIALNGATFIYDGAPKALIAATNPSDLTGLLVTYGGSATAPTAAGNYTVIATLTNANYTAAPATASLTISKAAQTIVWNNPAAITYGTALSAAQLNATALGALVYTPPAGTVLNAGNNTLSVSALATDNYAAASKSVTLVVNKAAATLSLSNLAQNYDGTAKPVTVTTAPIGLSGVTVTYGGSATVPAAAGTYAVIASLTNPNYAAASVSGTLIIAQPASLKVQYYNKDNQVADREIKPFLKLVNTGSIAVPYSQITARYWLTPENYTGALGMFIDYAAIGSNKVSMKYVMLPTPRAKALGYVEYSFAASAGTLAAGGSSEEIQSRIANTDWTDLNEANDHSYDETKGNKYIDNSRITLYRNGVLIWGTEPVAETPLMKLKIFASDRNGSPNTMNTYVDIRNEGNIPVDYKDVTARYWFTSDGTQPLTFSLDYAKIGNSNVTGSFTKLSTVRTNADTYLELKVRPAASTFYPLTSSGEIQYRINKSDWSKFNQANDHSYKSAAMTENPKITIYYKGQLVYGTEPAPMLAPSFMSLNRAEIADGRFVSTFGSTNTGEDSKGDVEATNALTPNGDGKNDTWLVKNLESGNSVKIYNRDGREVFSTKNYANDWDGTSQGSPLPEGTYYYILEVGQGKAPLKGYISIIR